MNDNLDTNDVACAIAQKAATLRRMLDGDAPADVLEKLDDLCLGGEFDIAYVPYTPEAAWYLCREMSRLAQDLVADDAVAPTVSHVLELLDWAGGCLLYRNRCWDPNSEIVRLLLSVVLNGTAADIVPYSYLWSAYRTHMEACDTMDSSRMLCRRNFIALARALVAAGSVCPPGEWHAMSTDDTPRRLHVPDDDCLLRLIGPEALVSARNRDSLHRGFVRVAPEGGDE